MKAESTSLVIKLKTLRSNIEIPFIKTFKEDGTLVLIVNEDEIVNKLSPFTKNELIKKSQIDQHKQQLQNTRAATSVIDLSFITVKDLLKFESLPENLEVYLNSNLKKIVALTVNVGFDCDAIQSYIPDEADKTKILDILEKNEPALKSPQISSFKYKVYAELIPYMNEELDNQVLCDAYNFFSIKHVSDISNLYNASVKEVANAYIKDLENLMQSGKCTSCAQRAVIRKYKSIIHQLLLDIIDKKHSNTMKGE